MNLRNGTKLLCIGLQLSVFYSDIYVFHIYKACQNPVFYRDVCSMSGMLRFELLACSLSSFIWIRCHIYSYINVCMKLQQVTTIAMVKNDHLKPPVGLSGLSFTIYWHIHTQLKDVMCVLSIVLSISALYVTSFWCQYQGACFYLITTSFVEIKHGIFLLPLVHNKKPYQTWAVLNITLINGFNTNTYLCSSLNWLHLGNRLLNIFPLAMK